LKQVFQRHYRGRCRELRQCPWCEVGDARIRKPLRQAFKRCCIPGGHFLCLCAGNGCWDAGSAIKSAGNRGCVCGRDKGLR
jgi:hypothetical protein